MTHSLSAPNSLHCNRLLERNAIPTRVSRLKRATHLEGANGNATTRKWLLPLALLRKLASLAPQIHAKHLDVRPTASVSV